MAVALSDVAKRAVGQARFSLRMSRNAVLRFYIGIARWLISENAGHPDVSSTKEIQIMNKHAILLAGVLAAMTSAFPAIAADDATKAQMRQADDAYSMAKKQAKADEKSAMAQCGTMSGEAKEQCKKDAKATHDKTMADAEATHDKAKADFKANK
jgi:hypothetical protein